MTYTITFSIRRHEEKSQDALSEQGKGRAYNVGQDLDNLVRIYHSELKRSVETAQQISSGAGIDEMVSDDRLNELNPDLPEGKSEQEKVMGLYKTDRDAFLQYFYENSSDQMLTAGANVLDTVMEGINNHNPEDAGKTIEYITHCPNIESAAMQVVKESIGVDVDLDYIGGHFRPGENFTIDVTYDGDSISAIADIRSARYEVDLDGNQGNN